MSPKTLDFEEFGNQGHKFSVILCLIIMVLQTYKEKYEKTSSADYV